MKTSLALFFVLVLASYTWLPLTQLALRGDGYVYFIGKSQLTYWKHLGNFFSFDWSAMAFGKVMSSIFGVKMPLYFWTEIVFLLATIALFFWAVLVIAKNRLVAFSASLMLAVNYFGNFDIYAGGIYPWFLERIPLMVFLIPSFVFLHLFLEKQNKKYYLWSLALFFLAIGMAHWGALFTGPYLFYPIFWQFFAKRDKKLLFSAGLKGLAYLGISAFFIFLQELVAAGVGPNWSFWEYLTQPQIYAYPQKMIKQLVYWTSYLPVFEGGRLKLNFAEAAKSLAYIPHVLLAYALAAIVIYKRLPKYRGLLLTIIFSVASIFYLNAYFGQYHIDTQPGSNRYLYLPTYLLSIFWSFFLWAVFWKGRGIKIFGGILLLAIYFFLNYWLVKTNFGLILDRHEVVNRVWNYVVAKRPALSANTLVVLPALHSGSYEAEFLNDQLGGGEVLYIAETEELENKVQNWNKAILISYDRDCRCVVEEEWK